MNLERVRGKQGEARFFLDKMRDRERVAFGNREAFDYYLSAFLSAALSIDYRLRHEQAKSYPAWRIAWNNTSTPEHQRLIRFLVDNRNVEVHESGSGRGTRTEKILIGNQYSDASGTVYASAPLGTQQPFIEKLTYNFTIDGAERSATEISATYLALLDEMVAKFEADHR